MGMSPRPWAPQPKPDRSGGALPLARGGGRVGWERGTEGVRVQSPLSEILLQHKSALLQH